MTEERTTTGYVVYCRVSTGQQERSGLGLADQEARCIAYAAAQGIPVVSVLREAESAKTLKRPVLQAGIAALTPGQVLLALNLSRITRTVRDLDELTAMIDRRGAAWEVVEDNFTTRTAMGRAMLRIVATMSQLEREQTAERTSHALRAKRQRGEWTGAVPFGYKRNGAALAPVPEQQAALGTMRAMRGSGASFDGIASALNESAVPTASGGRWSKSMVHGALSRNVEAFL